MKVAILRGHTVNEWEMQLYEPLDSKVDLTVFVPENNRFDVSNINIKQIRLKHSSEVIRGIVNIRNAYGRFRENKFRQSDFFYHTLREYLAGFDIVHVNDFMRAAYTAAALKEVLEYKLVMSYWENIPYCNIFSDKTTFLKDRAMNKIDCFVAYSCAGEKALLLEGIDKEKVTSIYPGINIGRFRPAPRDKDFASQLGVASDRFTVLYVGQFVSWKGVYNLIYAGKILKEAKRDALFVLAGSGAQKGTLQRLIRYAGLEYYFAFVDFVPYGKIEKLYHLADVFVLPSLPKMTWQEQFGMVLAEAMACGVPVVASRTGSVPEVVGDAGLLFTPGNFWELAEHLTVLQDNTRLLEELSVKSRQRAEDHFDARQNGQRLLEEYHKVLKT